MPEASEAQPTAVLGASLLHAPAASVEPRARSRWAYPLWGVLLASLFVAYHASVLVIWNSPGRGLAKTFHKTFLKETKGYDYFRGTRNNQSWAMFAPNPNRSNSFVRVFVEDDVGDLYDFEQDIWEVNRYPYVWYDRRGKVNRRIAGKKHFQRVYGAWVCREWERMGNAPAKSVTFVKRWTKVPKADQVIAKGGWDQWEAPAKQVEQETITCKTVINGQLPNDLRERYGLEPTEEGVFRPAKKRTWWDKAQAEERKLEREAKAAAKREQWEAERPQRDAKATKIDARGPVK